MTAVDPMQLQPHAKITPPNANCINFSVCQTEKLMQFERGDRG